MTHEVRIPDIGDIDEVEVIEICVAVGDQVGPDDALIVIESDKASMDVPAGVSGTVASIAVALGDHVGEGALIVSLETAATGVTEPSEADAATGAAGATETESVGTETEPVGPEPGATKATAASEARRAPAGGSAPGGGSAAGATREVRVPDIGEATDVVVIEVAVRPGDTVAADDLLVVVESDKASMEIPAGHAGTVRDVHVEVGSPVDEGTLLVTLETDAVPSAGDAQVAGASEQEPPARETSSARAGIAAPEVTGRDTQASGKVERVAAAEPATATEDAGSGERVYAGPAVRRLARELGVKLAEVKGSGNRGRILKDDVKAFVKTAMNRPRSDDRGGGGIPALPQVDFSRFGPVRTEPLSRIRAAGATNLHRSWLNLPHVTQFEDADVTELESFRRSLKAEAERRNAKITPLAFIMKACCSALQTFPTFNASLDAEAKNFILKDYYHIGFAVDTDDGLVVPVIRDADRLGVWELSAAIVELADKARSKRLGMADTQGGTFSISSLGNIGGTGFTPIINAPEVAILGVSRLVTRPVWDGEAFVPRQMLPLSLSYDHRAINGAEAGRFMAALAELLGDIRRLAL